MTFLIASCGPENKVVEGTRIKPFHYKTFDTKDTQIMTKAIISAMEKERYITKETRPEFGIIIAEFYENSTAPSAIGLPVPAVYMTTCTVRIKPTDDGKLSVCLYFVEKRVFRWSGSLQGISYIEDEKIYEEWFTRIEKELPKK